MVRFWLVVCIYLFIVLVRFCHAPTGEPSRVDGVEGIQFEGTALGAANATPGWHKLIITGAAART